MKDLRFSIAAVSGFIAFSLYLIGTHEADEPMLIGALSLIPILGGLFLASDGD